MERLWTISHQQEKYIALLIKGLTREEIVKYLQLDDSLIDEWELDLNFIDARRIYLLMEHSETKPESIKGLLKEVKNIIITQCNL